MLRYWIPIDKLNIRNLLMYYESPLLSSFINSNIDVKRGKGSKRVKLITLTQILDQALTNLSSKDWSVICRNPSRIEMSSIQMQYNCLNKV